MADLLSALRQAWDLSAPDEIEDLEERRSPHVEALLELADKAARRKESTFEALTAISHMQQRLAVAQEGVSVHESMTLPQRRIIERILQTYAENAVILDTLANAVRSASIAGVQEQARRLRAVTATLYRCHEAWEAESRETQVENDGMVMLPAPYAGLYEACEKLVRGEITLQDWYVPLAALEADIESSLHSLRSGFTLLPYSLTQDETCVSLFQEVDCGFSGSLDALDRMRQFIAERDITHLNDGWTALVEATLRAQRAIFRLQASEQPYDDMLVMDHEG